MAVAINIQREIYPDVVDAVEAAANKDERSMSQVAARAIRKGLGLPDVINPSVTLPILPNQTIQGQEINLNEAK